MLSHPTLSLKIGPMLVILSLSDEVRCSDSGEIQLIAVITGLHKPEIVEGPQL